MSWIKCSDRLPDTDRKVLVGNTSGWDIAYLDKDEIGEDFWRTPSWRPILDDYSNQTITHWQELPALPEEE